MSHRSLVALIALFGCATGACDAILAIPDRALDPHLACDGGACACGEGFADCDGNATNGCEADLSTAETCGACDVHCENASCKGGACKCEGGFADCDRNAKNGCEVSLETDSAHCGACARDCLGGPCKGGVCQPVLVGTSKDPGDMDVSGGYLFLSNCGNPAISRLPLAGGASVSWVDYTGPSNACNGQYSTVVGPTIFWASTSAIASNPVAKVAAPTFLATGVSPTQALAASSTMVYWGDDAASLTMNQLKRVPASGGAVETIPTGNLLALAADEQRAYWSDDTGVHSVPHTGTTGTMLASDNSVNALAVDATHLYMATLSVQPGAIESVPLGGGKLTVLGPAGTVEFLAVDEANVYWPDNNKAAIIKVPIAGGEETVLAAAQCLGSSIALDAQFVYWNVGDQIYKVAK